MGVKIRFRSGGWWIFIDHQGRRRAKKVGDRATALQVAQRVRERLALGDFTLLGTDTESLTTYATRWLTDGEKARKASTHRFYSVNLTRHILPIIGDQPIGSIRRAECRKAVAAGRAKGLKVASLYGVQRTLSAVLSQAVEDGILSANPAFRMGKHLRQGDEARARIHPLASDEARQFLDAVSAHWPDFFAFFLCALRTGLRLGELLALQSLYRSNFAVTAAGIYYATPTLPDKPASIEHRDFTAGKVTTLHVLTKAVDLGLALSPDGRYLLFAQRDFDGSDLMLVENFK